MKLTLERAKLLPALSRAARVIERRSTIPVLQNLVIKASGGHAALRATDLDIDIAEQVPAEIAEAGSVTAPGHMLADIVRKMPEGCQVQLEKSGERLIVKTGRSRFQLSTIPVEDFPDISAGELPHAFALAAKDFKGLVDRTQFAISTEETRYYLNGVFLHRVTVEGVDRLRGAATDGHRLAQVTMPPNSGAHGMPGIIVPRKTVVEVARLLAETPDEVQVALSTTKIRFGIGDVVLTSKLIDGTFPDYDRVVPAANPHKAVLDKTLLEKAVDRVSTVSSERGRSVKCAFSDGRLTLSVINPDAGDAVEEVDAEYEGPDLTIGFNSRYLIDILAHVSGDTVEIKLAELGSPALIQDTVATGALFVLMPMRV